MRILAVHLDAATVEFLRGTFLPAGYAIDLATGSSGARERVLAGDYSTVFIGRSDTPALALVQALRADGFIMPIVAVLPHDPVDDAIRILDAGADDVVNLPIPDALLSARLRAALRRVQAQRLEHLTVGDLRLDRVSHRVSRAGKLLPLTARQYALLEFLAQRAGNTVLRAQLLESVWKLQFDSGSNVIDVHIAQLRKRLRHSGTMVALRTVRGEGYALDPG